MFVTPHHFHGGATTRRRFRFGEQYHPKATLVALAFGAIATTTFTAFRLSDMGQPPLAAMLVLVPFVNIAVVIWCALSPGQPHNQYHQTSITRNPSNQNPPRRIRK